MKKTIILLLLIYIQTNTYSQRDSYFSASTQYFTPIYDLVDDISEDIEGIPSTFNTFEGGINILSWLRLGGFISLNNQSRKLLNAALQIGIKNIEIHYETGSFEGSVENTIPLFANSNNGTPISIGKFSNSFKNFAILKSMGDSNESYGSPAKYGLGITSLTLPTLGEVRLNDAYTTLSYLDPETRINYYGLVFKSDAMYLKLQGNSWYNNFGLDFASSAILGVTTAKPSNFGRNELEKIVRNGVENPTFSSDNDSYSNPNGFISNDRKTAFGFGISGDFRLGIGYVNNKKSKKIAFGAATGYMIRAWSLFSPFSGGKPEGDEYFLSTSGTFVMQHGPYLKAQLNW